MESCPFQLAASAIIIGARFVGVMEVLLATDYGKLKNYADGRSCL
jgi:hypothetical protein